MDKTREAQIARRIIAYNTQLWSGKPRVKNSMMRTVIAELINEAVKFRLVNSLQDGIKPAPKAAIFDSCDVLDEFLIVIIWDKKEIEFKRIRKEEFFKLYTLS